MKRNSPIFYITLTAMFAALICAITMFHFSLGAGMVAGYIHVGDAFIYLAAVFMPTPYAMAAAAIGAGFADLFSGYPVWIPFTVIIKILMVPVFTCKKERIINARNVIGAVVAGIIGLVGYYVAEALLCGQWLAPLASIPGGLIQASCSMLVFILAGWILDRVHIQSRLNQ